MAPSRRPLLAALALGPVLLLAACGPDDAPTGTGAPASQASAASPAGSRGAPATTPPARPTGPPTPAPPTSSATGTAGASTGTSIPTTRPGAVPTPCTDACRPGGAPSPGTSTSAPSASSGAGVGPDASARQGAARVPVYLAAPDGDPGRLRLFREYVVAPPAPDKGTGSAPGSATDADRRATVAVSGAMTGAVGPYRPLWGGRTVASVRRTGDGITVTLAGAPPAADAEHARLAVAQVVWTATAAYGADVPVRFVVPGGSSTLIGPLTTDRAYRREAGADARAVLAGIWVDDPAPGAVVPAGPVTARGTASVFEGTVTWQLARDGAGVARGVATASASAPARGVWTASLGTLAAGRYTLTVSSDDPSGKGTGSRVVHDFAVR